jgi:hypothetical protein
MTQGGVRTHGGHGDTSLPSVVRYATVCENHVVRFVGCGRAVKMPC